MPMAITCRAPLHSMREDTKENWDCINQAMKLFF